MKDIVFRFAALACASFAVATCGGITVASGGGGVVTDTATPAACSVDKDCDDGLTCTDDFCDPTTKTCAHKGASGRCFIDGKCLNTGDKHPADSCQTCDPAKSTSGFSNSCGPDASETPDAAETKDSEPVGPGADVPDTFVPPDGGPDVPKANQNPLFGKVEDIVLTEGVPVEEIGRAHV